MTLRQLASSFACAALLAVGCAQVSGDAEGKVDPAATKSGSCSAHCSAEQKAACTAEQKAACSEKKECTGDAGGTP